MKFVKVFNKTIKIFAIAIVIVSLIESLRDHFRNKKECRKGNSIYVDCVKRGIDFCFASFFFVILFPVYVLIAVLVRVKLGAPVLFVQERPGRDEKIFKIYKFRTMKNLYDSDGNLLPDDYRLTRFGRVLRNMSLDELPEVYNIIKGDMSIVGPRPLLVEYLPYYRHDELKRHSVRPGLTGKAQVNGRNAISWDEKLRLDVLYLEKISFKEDFRIVMKTVIKIAKRSDIQVGKDFVAGKFIEQRQLREE